MSTAPTGVEWNELMLVSYHRGQMALWAGWKRNLSAFADPKLWEDSAPWEGYFRRLPSDTPWGMDGYGLVFVDLDAKKAWSVNDYSHPGSVLLPAYESLSVRDETVGRAALKELLNHPDQWDRVVFQVARVKMLGKPVMSTKTLTEIIEGVGGVESLASIATRRGLIRLGKDDHMVFSGEYIPDGWECMDVRGKGDLEVLMPLLQHARSLGLPRPAVALMDDVVHEKIKTMEGDGEGGAEVRAQFDALLEQWPSRAPLVHRKPPGLS